MKGEKMPGGAYARRMFRVKSGRMVHTRLLRYDLLGRVGLYKIGRWTRWIEDWKF